MNTLKTGRVIVSVEGDPQKQSLRQLLQAACERRDTFTIITIAPPIKPAPIRSSGPGSSEIFRYSSSTLYIAFRDADKMEGDIDSFAELFAKSVHWGCAVVCALSEDELYRISVSLKARAHEKRHLDGVFKILIGEVSKAYKSRGEMPVALNPVLFIEALTEKEGILTGAGSGLFCGTMSQSYEFPSGELKESGLELFNYGGFARLLLPKGN